VSQSDGFDLELRCELGEVARATATVRARLGERGLHERAVYRACLVVEEMLTNAVRHGARGPQGRIRLGLELTPDELVLTFTDDGVPFDPLHAPPFDERAPLEERSCGGMGIHLVRQAASAWSYRRVGGSNRLEVRIRAD
jgi:anti-sigma regulatory factor (Ser/Thr protein kinase)